jgi:hypothetical protein
MKSGKNMHQQKVVLFWRNPMSFYPILHVVPNNYDDFWIHQQKLNMNYWNINTQHCIGKAVIIIHIIIKSFIIIHCHPAISFLLLFISAPPLFSFTKTIPRIATTKLIDSINHNQNNTSHYLNTNNNKIYDDDIGDGSRHCHSYRLRQLNRSIHTRKLD